MTDMHQIRANNDRYAPNTS